jgi:hydroxymethylpyrimidine pyrophosphatase-like HAD family hydrolase
MRYLALACDYDGTLALHGRVSEATLAALERVRNSGRKLLLVSGRELEDLQRTFDHLDVFDLLVLENGALLYNPATRAEKVLAERPPAEFAAALAARGVAPVSLGRVIVATWEPHENTVLETIRDQGLELQVVFNKGAVMVLPSGVNKATGLTSALTELGLSPHNVVGIGDAENDHAFLNHCECAVAVSNALPVLKERADWVTRGDHGEGVIELIEELVENDLSTLEPRLARYDILLGERQDGTEVRLKPYGYNLLIAGTSQGGKTTLATGVIERLLEQGYQLCILDPEGDYSELEGATALGDSNRVPTVEEALELLTQPSQSLVLNLLGIALEHRPAFFAELFPRLQELRTRTGRPHWIVVDETHHLLPASWGPATLTLPQDVFGLLLITLEPDHMAAGVLQMVDTIMAIGEQPEQTIGNFCELVETDPPPLSPSVLQKGDLLLWSRRAGGPPVWVRSQPPSGTRRRHHRKYAEGELDPAWSFYFRGPAGKLNLRAQNLLIFLQLADGVDDDTWLYHLRRHEYSTWFRDHIKDEDLAAEAAQVEADHTLSAQESRARIRQAVEQRYTAPA